MLGSRAETSPQGRPKNHPKPDFDLLNINFTKLSPFKLFVNILWFIIFAPIYAPPALNTSRLARLCADGAPIGFLARKAKFNYEQ